MEISAVCVAVFAAMIGASPAAQAQCEPAVVVRGEPALVESLSSRLLASGIGAAAPDCPAVRVDIVQRGLQLHLRLADASQRTAERDVQDIATAAALVESWTYDEIELGALPAERVVAVAPLVTPMLRGPRGSVRSGASASVLSGVGSNGATTWIGGALAACLRVGPLCVGGRLRAQIDTGATGDTSTLEQAQYALGALATLDLPRALGGLVITPGVGLGYSYLHVATTHHDASNNSFELFNMDHELCAAVHVSLARSLSDHVAAFADIWADANLARSDTQFGPAASISLALGVRFEAR